MSTVMKQGSGIHPEHASIVVLGGAAMGCSTVYHLAKAGGIRSFRKKNERIHERSLVKPFYEEKE